MRTDVSGCVFFCFALVPSFLPSLSPRIQIIKHVTGGVLEQIHVQIKLEREGSLVLASFFSYGVSTLEKANSVASSLACSFVRSLAFFLARKTTRQTLDCHCHVQET